MEKLKIFCFFPFPFFQKPKKKLGIGFFLGEKNQKKLMNFTLKNWRGDPKGGQKKGFFLKRKAGFKREIFFFFLLFLFFFPPPFRFGFGVFGGKGRIFFLKKKLFNNSSFGGGPSRSPFYFI